VDVTTGLRTVAITVGASDIGEGVDRVVVRLDRNFATSATGLSSSFTFTNAADSFADGVSSLSQRFDPSSGAGAYTVLGVTVFDRAGNSTSYTGADLTRLNIARSFQITSNTAADTVAPVLTGLTLPTGIDVRAGGGALLPVTVSASDTGRGVASVSVTFDRVFNNGSVYSRTVTIRDTQTDPFADGSAAATQFFSEFTEPGTYTVTGVTVTDKAGNSSSYDRADLTALGASTAIEVTSDTPLDTARPTLTAFDLPDVVDVTDGNTFLGIYAAAADAGTGVERVSVRFDRAFTDRNGAVTSTNLNDSSDSLANGATLARSLFASSQPGTYVIAGVTVYDVVGNSRFYSTASLAQLGFDTSFQVADRNLQPTVSVVAPAAIAEDGGAPLALSLLFAAGAPASGTVVVSFTAARSTATNGVDVDAASFSGSYSVTPAADGTYTLALPSIAILADQVVEGTETIAVTIRTPGQIFDTGSDSKTVLVDLVDSGQTGGAGADTITGTRFADRLSGLGGDDRLTGGMGNDRLDGGDGLDIAVFAGAFRQSSISTISGITTVAGSEGADTGVAVERYQFADGVLVIDPNSIGAQVQRLYAAVLDRQAEQSGLEHWLDQINEAGQSIQSVASFFLQSPEFQGSGVDIASNGAFVDVLYRRVLGRAADAAGRADWISRIDAGLARSDALLFFSESNEHRAQTASVTGGGYFETDEAYQTVALLYDSFADRKPDAAGLIGWAEALKSGGMTPGQVAAGFAASDEFRARTEGLDRGQLVDFMYRNTLDREADAPGRAHWVAQLDGGLSTGDMLLYFATSTEHQFLYSAHITGGIDVLG
jgi:hypothetical protein